jgi:hypothetical protein
MEKGAKALAYLLVGALTLGLLVVLAHPAYRASAASLLRGNPEAAPLWQSNADYYPDVLLIEEGPRADSE